MARPRELSDGAILREIARHCAGFRPRGATAREVSEKLPISRRQIYARLRELKKRGLIERIEDGGEFGLTTSGRAAAEKDG